MSFASNDADRSALRLSVLEPSKVRNQHITLLAGLAEAGAALPAERRGSFIAHASLLGAMSPAALVGWSRVRIPVMDPERRRLVRKSLLEAVVVCWRMIRLKRDEVLLVTCLLPPALIIVELFKRLLPRRHVVVMLHGEIEGMFEPDRQHRGSFGYYIKRWLELRRKNSTLRLSVIDDFIADEMERSFAASVRRRDIHVIPHPITVIAQPTAVDPDSPLRACFIGFRTKFKGFPVFERLAAATPGVVFEAIGGGFVEAVPGGASRPLDDTSDYMAAIAASDVAIFPYLGGYRASLSAAALDAVSAGVHIIASRRGFFVALQNTFGGEFVTLFDDERELRALMADRQRIRALRRTRPARVAAVAASKYGLPSVTRALRSMIAVSTGDADRDRGGG